MNNHIISNPADDGMGRTAQPRPTWSDPDRDVPEQSPRTHPDDRGAWYESAPIDTWTVVETPTQDSPTLAGDYPVRVFLYGFRHNKGPHLDWPDRVVLDGNTSPDSDETMSPATARRIALALLRAAAVLDPDHTWTEPTGGTFRVTSDGVLESYQSHADEWRVAAPLTGLADGGQVQR